MKLYNDQHNAQAFKFIYQFKNLCITLVTIQFQVLEHPQYIEYVLPLSLTHMTLVVLVFNEFSLLSKPNENLVLGEHEQRRIQFRFSVLKVDSIRWNIAVGRDIINCDLIRQTVELNTTRGRASQW
jgi:hypothetical protein